MVCKGLRHGKPVLLHISQCFSVCCDSHSHPRDALVEQIVDEGWDGNKIIL